MIRQLPNNLLCTLDRKKSQSESVSPCLIFVCLVTTATGSCIFMVLLYVISFSADDLELVNFWFQIGLIDIVPCFIENNSEFS